MLDGDPALLLVKVPLLTFYSVWIFLCWLVVASIERFFVRFGVITALTSRMVAHVLPTAAN